MRVGIVARRGNERAAALAGDVREHLHESGVEVLLDEATADALSVAGHPVEEMSDCTLVVSIGGDGTFLFTAREVGTTPIMGVNLGEVGFLNATSPDDALAELTRELDHIERESEPRTRTVPRLRVTGEGVSLPPALNEMVVMGERGPGRGAEFTVEIDGSEYLDSHADGVLVATQTGSTAYNLSEGGPLVHPDVPALVVTDMAAADPMPPLVVGRDSDISIAVADDAAVVADGRNRASLAASATVTVSTADEPTHVAGPPLEFFSALDKLD
jgi:NAD+ kinase